MQDAVGAQASGLTVGMEGRGHDLFLYWAADCLQHEGQEDQYRFIEGLCIIGLNIFRKNMVTQM